MANAKGKIGVNANGSVIAIDRSFQSLIDEVIRLRADIRSKRLTTVEANAIRGACATQLHAIDLARKLSKDGLSIPKLLRPGA